MLPYATAFLASTHNAATNLRSVRAVHLAILALAALVFGCVPIGTRPGRTDVVWSEGGARIERREFQHRAFVLLSPEPGVAVYDLAIEYWLIEDGVAVQLPHVRERSTYDKKTKEYDRAYAKQILGDRALGRWLLLAQHIYNRERADNFVMIFDRHRVITEVMLPNCDRSAGPRMSGLRYDPELKAVSFKNDEGEGWLDLVSGSVRR